MTTPEVLLSMIFALAAFAFKLFLGGGISTQDVKSSAILLIWTICLIGCLMLVRAARLLRKEALAEWAQWKPAIAEAESLRPTKPSARSLVLTTVCIQFFLIAVIGITFVLGRPAKVVSTTTSTPPVPKSLHDYFVADNFGLIVATDPTYIVDLKTERLTVEAKLYGDFNGKSAFLGFYIPTTLRTRDVCLLLLKGHRSIIETFQKSMPAQVRTLGNRATDLRDLKFTGRVFFYYEGTLFQSDQEVIETAASRNGMSVQFRGPEYASLQNIGRVDATGSAVNNTPKPPLATKPRELSIHFKNSPLFTPQRQDRISSRMESFHNYLVELGLAAPKEIPPIAVGNAYGGAFTYPGPIYLDTVSIPEKAIDDPLAPIIVYAQYSFGAMMDVHNFTRANQDRRQRAAWIFESSFVSSFSGKQPPLGTSDIANWAGALWEIRGQYGKQFTDLATAFALRAFNELGDEGGNQKLDLNTYFHSSFLVGENAVDNQLSSLSGVNAILKKHGL